MKNFLLISGVFATFLVSFTSATARAESISQLFSQVKTSAVCAQTSLSVAGTSFDLPAVPDGASVSALASNYEKIPNGIRWIERRFSCHDGVWSAITTSGLRLKCDEGYSPSNTWCTHTATHGTCGWADENEFSSKPTTGLCATGKPGKISTSNTSWAWSCYGSLDGTVSSCRAYRVEPVVNGSCGSAHGGGYQKRPYFNLCSQGTASWVEQNGDTWMWSCGGTNGGSTAVCRAGVVGAQKYSACGTDQGGTFTTSPSFYLCSAGTASIVKKTATGWEWFCQKEGGSASACWAYRSSSSTNGTCGSAQGNTFAAQPTNNLCATGYATAMKGFGPWYWVCAGNNNGSSENCSAYKTVLGVSGACGLANGSAFPTIPTYNLCSSGIASWVSGPGPWYWTCFGRDGGNNASCQARPTR